MIVADLPLLHGSCSTYFRSWYHMRVFGVLADGFHREPGMLQVDAILVEGMNHLMFQSTVEEDLLSQQ